MIVDLMGKAKHVRTVPVPAWTKRAVDEWTTAAGINSGLIFRRVSRLGKVWGDGTSLALTADARTLVSGSDDKTIKIWDLRTGRVRTLKGHTGGVTSVALSGDGRTLASGSYDNTIKVWDLGTEVCLGTFYADACISCVALSLDNSLAVGDASGRVHLFENPAYRD